MRRTVIGLLMSGCLLPAAGVCAAPAVYQAVSGDTVAVISGTSSEETHIRGIYAPYLQQTYGPQARQQLDKLLKGGEVVLEGCSDGECDVIVAGVSVAAQMIEGGHAWADTTVDRYGMDDFQEVSGNPLYRLEKQARRKRVGLWREAQPTPPWRVAYKYDKKVLEHNDLSRCNQGAAVVLYVTSWCPYCRKAEDFLSSRGVRFVAYDIEKDDDAAWCKNRLVGRSGVPAALINGRKLVGFSEGAYLQALGMER